MNIFGLFFTFMIPGILLGLLAASAIGQSTAKRRRSAVQPVKRSLFMYDLKGSAERAA